MADIGPGSDLETPSTMAMNETYDASLLSRCLTQLFDYAAHEYASNTALVCATEELSYRELNKLANRLARLLIQRGARRGELIVVALNRSVDLVVSLLAVLKTGAAYVPVDISFPRERISHMMTDASPKLVITHSSIADTLSPWKELCLNVDEAQDDPKPQDSDTGPQVEIQPEDLAYVIYTSGSTGKPKGVEISHGAVSNFLLSMQRDPGCHSGDRLLAVTTVSFDIAALELFLPLVCGATTFIAQKHEVTDAGALLRSIKDHGITMMQATPATWQLLLDSGWRGTPRLQKILCGGEALPRRLADSLLACADSVHNMYGPTEATIWASTWKVQPNEDVIIGSPIANTQMYVLDQTLKPSPMGSVGELYIGGTQVARGYHNKPDLTRSRFVQNPFHGGIMYQTGDTARFDSPERLSILGRSDDQVKIRGYRIELGDIEAAVTDHEEVSKAVTVSRDERLIAYCIRESDEQQEADENQMRSVADWAGAWDYAYGDEQQEDASLNIAGWHNSYDDKPISSAEMRDWQSSSVRRILSHTPKRAVEIGSGTGMILFGVAPHCTAYLAMDASAQAVDLTRRNTTSLPQVACEHRQAHALPAVEEPFDTVIINSVAQYFPSTDYLLSVIKWATETVDDGRLYVGDVRNLMLLDVFHGDIIDTRTNSQLSSAELADRAAESARNERELLLSPAFFANLPKMYPRITEVEITLRDSTYDNEMSRFRFDATIHIGCTRPSHTGTKAVEWRGGKLDLSAVRKMLDVEDTQILRVNGIPNGRLTDVNSRLGPAFGGPSDPKLSWVHPQVLKDLAAELDCQISLLPSQSDPAWSFDAVFWRTGQTPDCRYSIPESMDITSTSYANVPKVAESYKPPFDHLLRPWLADRLPAYMVPAFFVEVDEFPMTLNGKIDRKALPDPVLTKEITNKPANELESDILDAWAKVLGHDRIDVNDNFFQIGGDSLRVIRVQTELESLMGKPVSSAKIFEHYTIKSMAAYLTDSTDESPEAAPIRPIAHTNEDIAVVSMACRLPGGIDTPEKYWELLESGGDAITDVPKDRWNAEALYSSDPEASGKSYCRRGGFADSVNSFDAAFFGISPREARALDPMQYMMLESCWEGFERAGYTTDRLRGSQTGVFIGVSTIAAYQSAMRANKGLEELDGYAGTGSSGGTMSGRVSYMLGLEGPAMTIDTACSSSLVTTHLACNALRQGECDMAISGGVSLMLTPGVHVEFSRLRGVAPDGQCRAFSADTQGTSWSEGSAAVVLKRLSDAKRDNDPILAVLRGTAVNHGGRSASLTTPSGPAQKRLIQTALASSGLQPGDIDYIEAHGTGTKLGDPIEGAALAEVFGGNGRTDGTPLYVGSAKSNLGHTQAAAGLVGMVKVVLSMQHGILPATLHADVPTPAIEWKNTNMALVQKKQPWKALQNRLRRAGVSAFGIGGTNAHAIIEEYLQQETPRPSVSTELPHTLPFVLSGSTNAAIRQQAGKLLSYLSTRPIDRLEDVAYSLATTRNHFRHRAVLMAQEKQELMDKLSAIASGDVLVPSPHVETPNLAMLFTGQGSQVLGMGKDLAGCYPLFRQALEEIAAHFTELEKPLLEVMWSDAEAGASLLQRTDFAQPALFAYEVALWRLWTSWGVKPKFLLGHSVGEIAAAHAAGVIELSDACRLVAARGQMMQAIPVAGSMLSLEASPAEVATAIATLKLDGKVDVAAHNTPVQTVASGNPDAIETLKSHFATEGRKQKALKVSHAFHSHHMEAMLSDFKTVAETVNFHAPGLPIVSTLTGQLAAAGELERAEYWVQQVRNAVRFSDSIQTLDSQGVNVLLEIGPQPILCGMGAACHAYNDSISHNSDAVAWLPSAKHQKDAAAIIQGSLAELHSRNVPIDWTAYYHPYDCQQVELPTYAFQRVSFAESAKSTEWQNEDATPESKDTVEASSRTGAQGWDLAGALKIAAPEAHHQIVLDTVRRMSAEVLGLPSSDAVDPGLSLQDVGLDSFTTLMLRNKLVSCSNVDVSASTISEHPNVGALSDYLLQQLQESGSESSPTESPSSGATLETSVSTLNSGAESLTDDLDLNDGSRSPTDCGPTRKKDRSKARSTAPLNRVLSPVLGLNPLNTPSDLFEVASKYFDGMSWSSRLIHDDSPTSGPLPGCGRAVPFIPQCFNPASAQHDQFIGKSLAHESATAKAPIHQMLSIFRPSDPSHLDDPERHISRVASLYALGDGTSGYEGILHGGLTATLLDESISIVHEINTALGKTDSVFAAINVTASLNIRFLAPVDTSEDAVCVTAWVEDIQDRSTIMKAEMTNSRGEKLAEAESMFVAVPSKS